MSWNWIARSGFLAVSLFAWQAEAVTIAFSAHDLADQNPGEDLWRYDYTLDGFDLPAGYGFSVLFDPTLYTSLEDPPPAVSGDWDVISLQPDSGIPDPGRYDAQALVDQPAFLGVFSVTFVFLGSGAPGTQPFELYDSGFQVVESGFTVPEPGTALLGAGTLAVLVARRRRATRS